MSTDPSHPKPETLSGQGVPASPEASTNGTAPTTRNDTAGVETTPAHSETPAGPERDEPTPTVGARIGADWAAVIVAAVLVLLAVSGVLPAIPFLVK